jgi:hypothetical protein
MDRRIPTRALCVVSVYSVSEVVEQYRAYSTVTLMLPLSMLGCAKPPFLSLISETSEGSERSHELYRPSYPSRCAASTGRSISKHHGSLLCSAFRMTELTAVTNTAFQHMVAYSGLE